MNSEFHWHPISEEPSWDHTFLVSDGKVIGMAGYSLDGEAGEGYWHKLFQGPLQTCCYYGGHEMFRDGTTSKMEILISDIKFWCPIPSLSLQNII